VISKILKGSFKGMEGRAYEVWKYANDRASKAGHGPRPLATRGADSRLAQRISEVWDRTPEGADALFKLLDAADLMQKRRKSERGR
jgi:hypothetical protein